MLSLVQWLLMALRQAGLLVLAAMLPLAASGSLNRATRGWLDRLLVWLVGDGRLQARRGVHLLPRVHLPVLASATPDGNVGTMITGLMVLLLAVVAMPVLLKFFAWSGTQVGGGAAAGRGSSAPPAPSRWPRAVAAAGAVDRAAAMDATGPGSASTARESGGYGRSARPAVRSCGRGGRTGVRRRSRWRGGPSKSIRRRGDGMTGHDDERPAMNPDDARLPMPETWRGRGCTGTGAPNAAGVSARCRPPRR